MEYISVPLLVMFAFIDVVSLHFDKNPFKCKEKEKVAINEK